MKKFTPRAYQDQSTKWLLGQAGGILSADCGLGKTIIVLNLIGMLHLLEGAQRTLILAPKKVVSTNVWVDEAAKWQHTASLDVAAIQGTAAQRHAVIAAGAAVQIINFENIPWLMEHYYKTWPWRILVIDEVTKLRNPSGVWFKGHPARRDDDGNKLPATPGLKHAALKCSRVIGLTGTLLAKGPHDLWAQVFLLDQGQRLGKTISAFRERWFRQGYSGFGWEALPRAELEIIEQIKDLCLTIRAADYLDLPSTIHNILPVQLPAAAKAQYTILEKEFFLRFDGETVEAANAGVLSGKLKQFASGFLYTNKDATEWETVHTEKIDALKDFLVDATSPVIVAYAYRAERALLLEHIHGAVALDNDPAATKAAFMAGDIPVLLLHPASGAHGVEGLQQSCHTLVWYSLDWDLDNYQQANERIGAARQVSAGRTGPVLIHHIIARGTIDDAVLLRLTTKCSVQEAIRNAMKKDAVME